MMTILYIEMVVCLVLQQIAATRIIIIRGDLQPSLMEEAITNPSFLLIKTSM